MRLAALQVSSPCALEWVHTTITGLVIRSRIIQVCGLIAGIGGFFGALHFSGHTQLYVMAVVALIGLIVPGITILLQNQK